MMVALPVALGFGIASGMGAAAGLYGAIAVGFFASVFGGTRSQISGPTAPIAVAMAESLFATVECELLQRVRFATREQACSEIFRFLEGFYNLRRRHSALGYRSSAESERRWHEQREPVRL